MSEGLSEGLPVLGSVEALRFAADVAEERGRAWLTERGSGKCDPEAVPFNALELRYEADRLEREQAAKTAQDHAIEQAAQVMWARIIPVVTWDSGAPESREYYRELARHLADAGLLNTKHGEA